jgi:hypothetical protein
MRQRFAFHSPIESPTRKVLAFTCQLNGKVLSLVKPTIAARSAVGCAAVGLWWQALPAFKR